MSGIENILARISADATAECERIIADSQAKADAYKKLAAEEITADCEKLLADAEAEISASEKMADSGADLKYRQAVLSAKNALISDALKKALEHLNSLGEKEYFSAVSALCIANAEPDKSGELRFNSADLGRVPSSFESELNSALKAKNASVVLSKIPADISGGFVLVYGDIEENCSFESILEASADALRDTVNGVLFN